MVPAVCLPSRIMMLTGKSWRRIPASKDAAMAPSALPAVLSRAGYQTFHAGKGGNEYTAAMNLFDQNLRMDDSEPELRRSSSRRHADAVIRFLSDRDLERPFYAYVSPPVPHDARIAEPQFHLMYRASTLPVSPAFLPQHPFDNGEMTVRDEHLAPWPRTVENNRQQLADYYACISCLDYHLGRILHQLEVSGDAANTIVVFTGDNGLSMGDHGLYGKQNLYEFGGMHTPLIIAGPGIPVGQSASLVYLMDLFPTLCELASAELPDGVEGISLCDVVRGKTSRVRDVLYTGYRECMRAVRDDRWKLIRYPLVDRTQLFDLQSDPYELQNLADSADHLDQRARMMTLLQESMQQFGDDTPLTVADVKSADWTPP
jgi:arylsulfatase A-like enzyme